MGNFTLHLIFSNFHVFLWHVNDIYFLYNYITGIQLIHKNRKISAKMKFTLDKTDRYTIFKLDEDNLNSILAPDLKSEFVLLSNEGVRNLILDLSDVKYVDSSGLSAILTANRLWKDYGSFVLTGAVNPSVKKLIEISRLESILTIIPTVAESVDYVFMEDIEKELTADGDE